jgi:hypothetical protein
MESNREQAKEYLQKNFKNISLFICVPCYGGNMEVGFVNSLNNLVKELNYFEIRHSINYITSESLIPRGRNSFVSAFLEKKLMSHLLFLDADLEFSPATIIQLIIGNYEICGAPYPKKKINWDITRKLISQNCTNEIIENNTSDLNWNVITPTNENEVFIECKDIPTGCMLIQRSVFYALMNKYPERKYKNNVSGYNGKLFYDFFGVGVVDGVYLSEDYYFCYLCREAGFQLFLDKTAKIGHIGKHIFRADLQSSLDYDLHNLQLDFKA